MPWTKDEAVTAVQNYIAAVPLTSIEVLPWTREMALANLTEKKCRVMDAAHLYVDLLGLDGQLPAAPTDDEYRQMLQAVHAYTRVAIEAVERKVDGLKVQFQGLRLHAVFFRPYGDGPAMCEAAVGALCYLRRFVRNHFAAAFPDYPGLKLQAGLDWGPALVTGLGAGDDREVLFIGDAANRPAKALARARALALADGALSHLADSALADFVDVDEACLDLSSESKVFEALGLDESVVDLKTQLDACLASYPLEKVTIRSLTGSVDWERLGPTENRKVSATTVFADLSGFTAFVEGRMDDTEQLRAAVQILHVLRREFCRVAYLYGFERVAYQGDRLQALRRNALVPAPDAVEACLAMRESLKDVVHAELPDSAGLGVAIGADGGEVLLSRVGKIGAREKLCVGASARSAAQMEERLAAGKVGLGATVRAVLTEDARDLFVWSANDRAYVNTDASVEDLQLLLIDGATHSLRVTDRGIEAARGSGMGMPYVQTNSWRRDAQ